MSLKFISILFVVNLVSYPNVLLVNGDEIILFDYVNLIRPIYYDVHLFIDGIKELRQYTGVVNIKFKSLTNSNFFNFKSSTSIDITNVELINLNKSQVIDSVLYRRERYFGSEVAYTFQLVTESDNIINEMEVYELELEFNRNVHQYYDKEAVIMNKYNVNNVVKYFAFTRFQAEYIIQLIPCFEDISFKTPIKLRITHQPLYTALSNMPGRVVAAENDLVTTEFEETPPMTAHLLAFAVGEFQSKSVSYSQNMSFTIYSSPEVLAKSGHTLEISGNILFELENYLQTTYPLPKIDYIIVPDIGYYPGAVHWSFILFKESQFVGDSKTNKTNVLMENSILNAHLLSRQYFGNLVTPEKWEFYWLTQGFSTFFSYFILDQAFPHNNYIDQFITDNMYPTFELYGHFHKVNLNPNQMPYWYLPDKLGIRKASSILRMVAHMMGGGAFRAAAIRYITQNAYGSTTPDDLIHAYEVVLKQDSSWPTNISIDSVINNWLDNSGVPILTVTRNYRTHHIGLEQNYSGDLEDLKSQKWWIAYNYATKTKPDFENTKPIGWMKQEYKAFTLGLDLAPDDWIIFNKQYTNLYVVNYDEQNWNRLLDELLVGDFERIHVTNRAQIINDLNLLVTWGKVNRKLLIKSLFSLRREKNYLPWVSADVVLHDFWNRIQNTEKASSFKEFVIYITGPSYDHFRINVQSNEFIGSLITRTILVKWACWAGHRNCLHDMDALSLQYLSSLYMAQTIYVHPDIKDDLFCFGFQNEANYKQAFEYFLAHPEHPDEPKFFKQFGCKTNTTLFRKYYFVGFHIIPLAESEYPALNKVVPQMRRWPFEENLVDMFYYCLMENCYDFKHHYPKLYPNEIQYRMRIVFSQFINKNDFPTLLLTLKRIQEVFGNETIEKIDKYVNNSRGNFRYNV